MNTSNKTNKAANDLLRSELYLGFIQQKSKVLGFDNLVSILVDTRSYLLKDGCAVQQVMMPMQSRDADEPRQQMTDGVPQQGTAELSGVDICIPEQPA